ncbi:non-specific lipid transfer protein GPI-anchored 7-like isoform X2 [Musa acuminata AAA Group]|uniref:non-specific lipid transfer protein GPI-anchored 7-like isoform X2 n=1 Tax=Musa acuminata AAA Group TaxID=214697 RepID=UPI0031D3BE5F
MAKWMMMVMMVVVAISGGAEGQLPPPCVSSLIPCAAYVNSTRSPPATCCDPLRQAVDADLQCLCAVLNDQSVLKAFNVTTDQAFRLAKSCGVSELSGCSGAPSPSAMHTPPTVAGGDGRDKGDAHRANWIGLSSFMSLSLLFWCSAVGL